jgi:hypothetical protein
MSLPTTAAAPSWVILEKRVGGTLLADVTGCKFEQAFAPRGRVVAEVLFADRRMIALGTAI